MIVTSVSPNHFYIDVLLPYYPPETNIALENHLSEDKIPFGMAYFQGRTASFREGITYR